MPTRSRCWPFAGVLTLAVFLAGTIAVSAQPPGVESAAKRDPQKTEMPKANKETKPLVVKLPDGTFLWLGGTSNGERVTLTPQEYQKLVNRVDTLKKELGARKPTSPSECAIRGRVEKRGEQLVATLKLTYSFHTTQANTAVSLGGRRAFLVAAALNGAKLPVLDTGEDGFAVMVETAGDHTLVLDVEVPVTARGTKAEVGFDLGLPRAPITTLALEPSAADVKRVNLTTRTPDPAQPTKTPDNRRLTGVDVKQLTARNGHPGFALGPIDSLEVTWDPPAASAQPADQVQSAEFDVAVVLTEGFIESTAKIKLRGPAREWKIIAPSTADISVERVTNGMGETGPTQQPIVTKPTDAAKIVWKLELPLGSSATDWTVTAVVRQPRPKANVKPHPLPVGPFAVLDVLRQTGTVRVTAGSHTRFVFKHGPDLRRAESPTPVEEDNNLAFFRLATGPVGSTPTNTPLLTVEVWPVEGTVRVKPTYKLELTEAGWHIRAEVTVQPIRTEIDTVLIDVPAEWRGLESASAAMVVDGVTQGKVDGPWRPVTVRLAMGMKKPFDIVLVGTMPIAQGSRNTAIAFPRFPKALERDATVTATVPEGLEVHGKTRGWDGDLPASWSTPLTAVPNANGKLPKAVTTVTGKETLGLARVSLDWTPYHPDVTADVQADVTIGERQVVVSQTIKLSSTDGFPKPVRFSAPAEAVGLKAFPALDSSTPGTWALTPLVEAKETTLQVTFAIPLPAHGDSSLSLPVGLLWPVDVSRVETNVRVWVNSVTGRTVVTSSRGWRELPPEPVPKHDSLPSLTLAASSKYPLVLEVRESTPEAIAAVRVERALIEAGMTEDGSVSYRARFRLQLYLIPAIDIVFPPSIGPNPTARVDGVLAGLVPVNESDGRRKFRITLPSGVTRATILELNYTLPGSRFVLGETVYQPPLLALAAYTGPIRWLITEPADAAPLLFNNHGRVEMLWQSRGITYAPSAASRVAMDRWLTSGVEPESGDTANAAEGVPIVVRQAAPDAVRVVRVPWLALVIGCSLVVALVVVLLAWLPTAASALMVAVLGGAFGAAVVLYPEAASQLLAAGQPGFVLGVLAVATQAIIRWQARRRITHLPGFTRSLPEPSAVLPSTATIGTPTSPPPSATRNRTGSSAPAATPLGR